MTLILELDLDIVMVHSYTKFEVFMSNGSKVIPQTDKLTDRQTDKQTDRQTNRQTNRQT